MAAKKIDQLAELRPFARGWNIDTYAVHAAALRQADAVLREADIRFDTEQDRRYTEINIEKEKALAIEKKATTDALNLAREQQIVREAQNDQLRDKTLGDSGVYATNASVTAAITELKTSLQPLVDYVSTHKGAELTKANLYTFAAGVVAVLAILYYLTRPGS